MTFSLFKGAHLNPAVTLGFASVQRLPLWKVPIYITSQMLSSIMSSALVYALYHGKNICTNKIITKTGDIMLF